MIIEQGDLFRETSRNFIKEFMENTVKETHEEGEFLFRNGDQARHFYILLKGRVRLSTGETGHVVHMVDRPGETFGWSSLVGRQVYSASAECTVPTKLSRIDREKFEMIVEKDPVNAALFYRSLAATVGRRLVNSYHSLILAQPSEEQRTYGSTLTLQQRSGESGGLVQ